MERVTSSLVRVQHRQSKVDEESLVVCRFWGFDLSVTSSGVVCLDGGDEVKHMWLVKGDDGLKGLEKAMELYERLISKVKLATLTLTAAKFRHYFAVEGFAFGAKGQGLFQLGALAGLFHFGISREVLTLGNKVRVYQPTQVKKFTCRKGTAKKDLMLKEVYRRWNFDTTEDDLADAYAIAKLLKADLADQGLVDCEEELDVYQRDVLKRVRQKGEKI